MQRIRELIEQTVSGLGYEVVDIEFAASGLLRVFIDNLADGQGERGEPKMIRVEDCEKVSHQLGHVLEVEEVDYSRLEISSPGMDRPLKTIGHFQRFAGEQVSLKLRQPFEGQRNFSGVLTDEGDGRFGLEMTDSVQLEKGKKAKPRKTSKSSRQGQQGSGERAKTDAGQTMPDNEVIGRKLVFGIDEVERARLVPTYDFRRHG